MRFHISFWIGLALLCTITLAPYFLLGEGGYIRIHDTLEGELVWLKVLSKDGSLYNLSNNTIIRSIFDGMPRNWMPSGYTFIANICHCFGIFKGYIIANMFFRIIGFVSFFVFLKYTLKLIVPDRDISILSFIYASMGFFPVFGISVMGVPLLAIAIFDLYSYRKNLLSFCILFLFPFFSSFIWSGIPFIVGCLLLIIYLYVQKLNYKSILKGWIVFCTSSFIVNIQLINGFLIRDFVSHRTAYQLYNSRSTPWADALVETLVTFFNVHYHISTFFCGVILVFFLVAYYRFAKMKIGKWLLYFILFTSIYQGLYIPFEYYVSDHISLIKSFRLNRFNFVIPFMWMVLLALTIKEFYRNDWYRKMIFPTVAFQAIMVFCANDEYLQNYRTLFHQQKFPSYRDYFAKKQFDQIASILKKDTTDYTVVSIGMSPTIAQYHGYHCLDGLYSIYDLNYKKKFRIVFENELNKSYELKNYFDGWGNRCYLFPSELTKNNVANNKSQKNGVAIHHLDINTAQLRLMKCRYIFSACKIENAESLHLKNIYMSGTKDFWTIYLYKL